MEKAKSQQLAKKPEVMTKTTTWQLLGFSSYSDYWLSKQVKND